jgi:NAD(P)-dependent dehydrogenase (short-subunit alcohol dehydrogenase family)
VTVASESAGLIGRVVLVAHSDSSIGRAVVKRLAAGGALVETVEEETGGDEISAWQPGPLRRLDAFVVAPVGAVVDPFPEASLDDYKAALQESLRTMFFLTQQAVRAMKDGGRICMSSPRRQAGMEGHFLVPSTVVEGGVIAMVRLLAVEMAPRGIAVNGVCPVGARADVESVASAVAFLGSADASYVTGTFIPVTA